MITPSLLKLRPWKPRDVYFCLKVRNDPRLYRWFRQDKEITLAEQLEFMQTNTNYNGQVIEYDGISVGLCAVRKDTKEFSIAILPEWQGCGIAKEVMKRLGPCWSEVFATNPALGFYLSKCGFKVTGVKEKHYFKKGIGLVDTVRIQRG